MKWLCSFVLLAGMAGCQRPDHVAMFDVLLKGQYGGVVPESQQEALEDGRITRDEVEQAVTASLACMAEIDGVAVDEPFRWREDGIEFGGSARPLVGVDESTVVPLMDDCYYAHAALVETAWFDQEYLDAFSYVPSG